MSQRLTLILVVALAGVFLVTGCATTDRAAQQRNLFVDTHPDLTEQEADAILNGRVMVGMNREMVEVAWGKPVRCEKVDSDKLKAEVEEEITDLWIYGNYFVGGTITSLYFDEDGQLVRYEVWDQSTNANSSSLSMDKQSAEGVKVGADGSLERKNSSRP